MTAAPDALDVSFALPARVKAGELRLPALLEIAEHVDSAPGWHGLWVQDSILALPFYDSTVLLAALAARTTRVRLGVACLATLGLRQPLVVAQQWANLDELSGGRVTMIACPGNRTGIKHERERAAFGIDYDEKLARMLDAIDFPRSASAADRVTYHSEFLDLDDVELRPGFQQRPLPIWMVANPSSNATPQGLERVFGRVARYGDGWLTHNARPAELRERARLLDRLRAGLGREDDDFPVAVQVNLTVAETEAQAVAKAQEVFEEHRTRGGGFEDVRAVSAIGTPEQCAQFLRELQDAGANHAFLYPLAADPLAQARIASEHLLPLLAPADRAEAPTRPTAGGRASEPRRATVETRPSTPPVAVDVLVCALGADQFAGTAPTRYARRGHIPGSRSLPARDLAGPLGALLPPGDVRARASAVLPVDGPVVLYCGGGISASFAALGLVRAGYRNLRVYDGSLEEWAADPRLPLTAPGRSAAATSV